MASFRYECAAKAQPDPHRQRTKQAQQPDETAGKVDLVTTSGQPVHDGAGGLLHRHQTGHGKIIFGGERRLDKAGADQGHPDPFAGQIEAQGIRQIVEGGLEAPYARPAAAAASSPMS